VWGGVIGGLVADAVEVRGTEARDVLLGASLGATLGVVGGVVLARRDRLTRGDVALVDTLAGSGMVAGLTLGMLMQPPEGEAYVVNAMFGAAAGVTVGLFAAPRTSATPRRMIRIAGVAAIGAGAPFLLYAAMRDPATQADERLAGGLSTIGLVVGLYVGARLTRALDVGRDLPDQATRPSAEAPAAVVGRSADGRWAIGAVAITPLSPLLAPQPGLAMPLVAGAF